jgi:hypothetical protein
LTVVESRTGNHQRKTAGAVLAFAPDSWRRFAATIKETSRA